MYLFGDKITIPQGFDAFYVTTALVVLFIAIDFSLFLYFLLSKHFCEERTKPINFDERKMKQAYPSPVSLDS